MLFAPDPGGEPPFAGSDKVVHYVLFALLAATVRWRFGPSRRLLWAVVAYAVVSEIIQGLALSNRSGDPGDVFADIAGAAAGWIVTERILKRRLSRAS